MSALGAAHQVALVDTNQQIMLPQSLEVTTSFVVHEQGRWFEDELRFVTTQLCQNGWEVLDIGASFGLYTLALSACVGPTGRVTSFEPSPGCVQLLRESLKLNGVTNVTLVDLALSDTVGTARLVAPGTPELGVLQADDAAHEGAAAAAADSVLMTTLDAFKEHGAVDYSKVQFVKMDVEGCETKVLNGGSSLFDDASPVVLFEVNNAGQWNAEVVQAFEERGYACYRLLPGLDVLIPAESNDMDSYLLNLFAIKAPQVVELEARGLLIRPPPASVATRSGSGAGDEASSRPTPERSAAAKGDGIDQVIECDTGRARRALFEGAGYCRGHVDCWSVPAAQQFPGEVGVSSKSKGPAHLQSSPSDREMWEFLDAWAIACDRSAPAAARWAALQRSWLAINAMTDDKSSCSRGRLLTYTRVCSDLGLRTRAVEALIVLIQRGLPPSIAGEGLAPGAKGAQCSERQGEVELGAKLAVPDGERGAGTEEGRTEREEGMGSGQTAADGRREHIGEGSRLESRQQGVDGQGEGEGSEQNSEQPWRDTPAGFGSAQERRTAADARSARGSPRQKVPGDAAVQSGSKDITTQKQEMLWSEPFLPCSSISAGCLLHESMGAERRAAWYEASLLYEAVVQQWFSLGFVQSAESLTQSVSALQRVLGLGFFMEEASRRLATVMERQRQREVAGITA